MTTSFNAHKCGNQETLNHKKSFLGFQKCICTACNTKLDGPSFPLNKGYRITYWAVGVWFAIVLLGKLPVIIDAAAYGLDALLLTLVEQWVITLFVAGSILALRKDAAIRKRNRLAKKVSTPNNSIQPTSGRHG